MQEELPLDPDEIGEYVDEEKSTLATFKTVPSINATQPGQSLASVFEVQSGMKVEPLDTLGSIGCNETNAAQVGKALTGVCKTSARAPNQSPGQSLVRVAAELSSVKAVSAISEPQARVPLTCVEVKQEHPIIDLTVKEEEPMERTGSEDHFDDFMDDLDEEGFCSSFTNFDDDDKECTPSDKKEEDEVELEVKEVESKVKEVELEVKEVESDEEGSSCGEEWAGEDVDYVKTVAEMAEEVNISDLFDPNVLGKSRKE